MNKQFADASAALQGVLFDGIMIAARGFGLCGILERLIDAIVAAGTRQMMSEAFPVARCTIERLMRDMGLQGVIRDHYRRLTG